MATLTGMMAGSSAFPCNMPCNRSVREDPKLSVILGSCQPSHAAKIFKKWKARNSERRKPYTKRNAGNARRSAKRKWLDRTGDIWWPEQTCRHIHISTHLDTSRHISTHLDTSRHISTHCNSRIATTSRMCFSRVFLSCVCVCNSTTTSQMCFSGVFLSCVCVCLCQSTCPHRFTRSHLPQVIFIAVSAVKTTTSFAVSLLCFWLCVLSFCSFHLVSWCMWLVQEARKQRGEMRQMAATFCNRRRNVPHDTFETKSLGLDLGKPWKAGFEDVPRSKSLKTLKKKRPGINEWYRSGASMEFRGFFSRAVCYFFDVLLVTLEAKLRLKSLRMKLWCFLRGSCLVYSLGIGDCVCINCVSVSLGFVSVTLRAGVPLKAKFERLISSKWRWSIRHLQFSMILECVFISKEFRFLGILRLHMNCFLCLGLVSWILKVIQDASVSRRIVQKEKVEAKKRLWQQRPKQHSKVHTWVWDFASLAMCTCSRLSDFGRCYSMLQRCTMLLHEGETSWKWRTSKVWSIEEGGLGRGYLEISWDILRCVFLF